RWVVGHISPVDCSQWMMRPVVPELVAHDCVARNALYFARMLPDTRFLIEPPGLALRNSEREVVLAGAVGASSILSTPTPHLSPLAGPGRPARISDRKRPHCLVRHRAARSPISSR